MIIGASSFAGTLPELGSEVDSIELYIPKLEVYEGTKLIKSRICKSNVATAHPIAAELRGMIVPSLCSFVFIQYSKASFGKNLL
ncbi:MAG TPA: hypothetical protein VF354_00125, partial [Candidatus Methanoperedens sp.]